MKYNREKAYLNGIFIQQDADFNRCKGYCVTFPIIDQTGKTSLFPTKTFKTFNQALEVARIMKNSDSRLKNLPIWCNQLLNRGCCGKRLYTLIQVK